MEQEVYTCAKCGMTELGRVPIIKHLKNCVCGGDLHAAMNMYRSLGINPMGIVFRDADKAVLNGLLSKYGISMLLSVLSEQLRK